MLALNSITSNTWYVSPSITQTNVKVSDKTSIASATGDVMAMKLLGGYQWMASSGFNFKLGAGATVPLSSTIKVQTQGSKSSLREDDVCQVASANLALEAKLGWAF